MPTRTRTPGEFCWINMLTPHTADARAFFASVLGWTYVEMPGMGHRIQVGGRDIGGLFDLASPQTPPGTRAYIGLMVKVANADDTCARITSLGGTARPPFDIMDQGRMAVCFDPNGAEFDIWEARKGPGTDVDPTLHGAPSWFETLSTDVPRTTAFYSALFGWKSEVTNAGGFDYTSFVLDGHYIAGTMTATPEMQVARSHWGVYFTVADVDKTASDAATLGAVICVPPRDIPGVGRFCGIISPQGVTFYAITYAR